MVFSPSVGKWNCERAAKGPQEEKTDEDEFPDHRPGSREPVCGSAAGRGEELERREDYRSDQEASQEAHEEDRGHEHGGSQRYYRDVVMRQGGPGRRTRSPSFSLAFPVRDLLGACSLGDRLTECHPKTGPHTSRVDRIPCWWIDWGCPREALRARDNAVMRKRVLGPGTLPID